MTWNGLAHTFDVRSLPEVKKKYDGQRLDTPEGMAFFFEEMYEITSFLDLWLAVATDSVMPDFQAASRTGTTVTHPSFNSEPQRWGSGFWSRLTWGTGGCGWTALLKS